MSKLIKLFSSQPDLIAWFLAPIVFFLIIYFVFSKIPGKDFLSPGLKKTFIRLSILSFIPHIFVFLEFINLDKIGDSGRFSLFWIIIQVFCMGAFFFTVLIFHLVKYIRKIKL